MVIWGGFYGKFLDEMDGCWVYIVAVLGGHVD